MIKQFNKSLQFIENAENYYAGFSAVMEHVAIAMYLKTCLWDIGEISDTELMTYSMRIQTAREKAIETHKAWTISILKQNEARHSVESITSSIYNDLFKK